MARFRWAALVGAAIGVVCSSSMATAGPLVAWSFRAEAEPRQAPRVLIAELAKSEGSYRTPSGYAETVGLIAWHTESGHPLPTEGGMVSISEGFGATVTLTDTDSGEPVDFGFWLEAWTHWDQKADGQWDWIASGQNWGPYPSYEAEWFPLGRNQYRVWHEAGALVVSV